MAARVLLRALLLAGAGAAAARIGARSVAPPLERSAEDALSARLARQRAKEDGELGATGLQVKSGIREAPGPNLEDTLAKRLAEQRAKEAGHLSATGLAVPTRDLEDTALEPTLAARLAERRRTIDHNDTTSASDTAGESVEPWQIRTKPFGPEPKQWQVGIGAAKLAAGVAGLGVGWTAGKLVERWVPMHKNSVCRAAVRWLMRNLGVGIRVEVRDEDGHLRDADAREAAELVKEAPFVVANHVTYFDALVLSDTFDYSPFVSSSIVKRMPMISSVAQSTGTHFLVRKADVRPGEPYGGRKAIEFMKAYPSAGYVSEGKPLIVFPEGSTGNGEELGPFNKGVFTAGKPVRPLILDYESAEDDEAMPNYQNLASFKDSEDSGTPSSSGSRGVSRGVEDFDMKAFAMAHLSRMGEMPAGAAGEPFLGVTVPLALRVLPVVQPRDDERAEEGDSQEVQNVKASRYAERVRGIMAAEYREMRARPRRVRSRKPSLRNRAIFAAALFLSGELVGSNQFVRNAGNVGVTFVRDQCARSFWAASASTPALMDGEAQAP